ncbi:hypothetical protein TYRP_005523 [Tyrophagus putrescentiae]|nr:hypothetical protein TYRP_005523 [Tyrophagus putrescentiae]
MKNDNNNNNGGGDNHHGSEAGTLIGLQFGHHEPSVVVRPPRHGLLDPNANSNENGISVKTATYVVMPPLNTFACTTDAGGVPTWTPFLLDMSNCSSLWVTHLAGRLCSHKNSVFTMAEELAKGAKGKKMYSGDLIRCADIVKQLVSRLKTYLEESLKEEDQKRRANVIKELLNLVLNVAINLLEEIQMES